MGFQQTEEYKAKEKIKAAMIKSIDDQINNVNADISQSEPAFYILKDLTLDQLMLVKLFVSSFY